MSTREELREDARRDKIGKEREGLDKCPVCKEWSIDQRDGKCKNEDCDGENEDKKVEDARDMLAEGGENGSKHRRN